MPTITIDGRQVKVEPETTVIQAAEKLGIYVPRYCYHPGLSIAGSCRMCLVEIEKIPKMQIACNTRVQEGMVVTTQSETAQQGRRAMLEFLLINHPLDCPVCDQSGECDLQNFYMELGQYQSRFYENKIKRKKAVPIGPHVVLDQERCILCTRCTRFTDEISKSHELGVFNRGNGSVIDLVPGRTLDNPYSGNVIDICPVGALTEREFRFKCRVWYLSQQNSICTGCARGCNISIHFNPDRRYKNQGRRVQRLKPRFNPHVNRWWMCDVGRFGFEDIDANRLESSQLRENGRLEAADTESALSAASGLLQRVLEEEGAGAVGVIASPQMSNEELYLVRKLFVELLQVPHLSFRDPWQQPGFQDDFLLRADRNPNAAGAEAMGLDGDTRSILEQAAAGRIRALYIFRHDFSDPEARQLLKQAAPALIFQGTNWNSTAEQAQVVLAGAAAAEKDGTFTNFEGRLQRFQQAFLPLEDARDDTQILLNLAGKLGHSLVYQGPEDLFMEWQGRTYDELDEYGESMAAEAAPQG